MPVCKKAGVVYGRFEKGGFIFHDLRHTFNTNMRKAGVAESIIMAITGYSTREMFDRYNRVDLDDTKQAVDRLYLFWANGDQKAISCKILNQQHHSNTYQIKFWQTISSVNQ